MPFIDEEMESKAHPEHPVILTSVDKPFECDGCFEPGSSMCYRCTQPYGKCRVIFHEECAKETRIITHPLSVGCVFEFVRTPNPSSDSIYRICVACCSEIKGFYYLCTTKAHKGKGHFMHPPCMKLQNHLDCSGIKLELRGTVPGKCGICLHERAFGEMKGWSYKSPGINLCLHIKCVKQMFLKNWKNMRYGPNSGVSTSASAPPLTLPYTVVSRKASTAGGNATPGGQTLVLYQGKMDKIKEAFVRIACSMYGNAAETLANNVYQARITD